MYRRKIDADYIDDYDEDIKQIQLLEDQIHLLEQHVRNMEYRIRQKITKRVELELLIKGFHEDQQFDKNFWQELSLEKKEKARSNELTRQKSSPDDGLGKNIEQNVKIEEYVEDDTSLDILFERLRERLQ
ncbi:hypothetical protein V3C99_011860 [Haemonchus contortus]